MELDRDRVLYHDHDVNHDLNWERDREWDRDQHCDPGIRIPGSGSRYQNPGIGILILGFRNRY